MTKESMRKKCLKQLKMLPKAQEKWRQNKINRALLNDPVLQRAQSVLLYWPLGLEVDIKKSIMALKAQKKVYLPFMVDDSFKMVPFRFPLHKKQFGIFEPGNSNVNIKKIDVVIVPIIGVDGDSRRIGFGKGMYDRFFGRLKTRPYVIFVQAKLCSTTKYICDDYDVRADTLLTPTGCYSASKGRPYDKRNTLRRRRCNP